MSGATGARLVAAVGAVCGIAALWTRAGAGGSGEASYWHDGTLGAVMLAAGVVVLGLLVAAERTRRHAFDTAGVAVGSFLFGLLLFNPVFWAPTTLGHLGAAAWLGLCSALVPLALLSLPPAEPAPPAAAGPARSAAVLLVLAGSGLAIAGAVWSGSFSSRLGYWYPAIRGLGVCLIVLSALALLLSVVAFARRAPFASDGAVACAAGALGFAAYVPVNAAFQHLGILGAGAWLALGGSAVLLLGVLLQRGGLVPRRRPRTAAV
jgi:hypothetical protein